MFRVIEPVEIEFLTSVSIDDTRQRILATLGRVGARIKVDSSRDIVAGFGSGWKARILGALLAGIDVMPRDVVVKLVDRNGKTEVRVSVRDTFGFGSRAGLTNKVQKLMYDNALAIKSQFPDAE